MNSTKYKGTIHHKFKNGRSIKPPKLPTWYGYRQEVSRHFGISERTLDNWIIQMRPEVIKFILERYQEKLAEEVDARNELNLFAEKNKR